MNQDISFSSPANLKENAAYLKTLRESLGLTLQWVADAANVKLRTAQYWEAGRMPPPLDVINKLEEIDKLLQSLVEEAKNGYINQFFQEYGFQVAVPLFRYSTVEEMWKYKPKMQGLPLACYSTYLFRLKSYLQSQDKFYFIGGFEGARYERWLAEENKIDCELHCAIWLSTYYGCMSEEALRGRLFSQFISLSNSPHKEIFSVQLTAEGQSTVLDEIVSYEASDEPRLRLLAFYFYCLRYQLFKEEDDRIKALNLSKISLWKLGGTIEEQLCFYDGLSEILELCSLSKDTSSYKEGDFFRFLIYPINKVLTDKAELSQENVVKILASGEFLIRLDEYPHQLRLKNEDYDFKRITKSIKDKVTSIYKDKKISSTENFISFLEEHHLLNERIRERIEGINPLVFAEKQLHNMQWKTISMNLFIPDVDKASLMDYVISCKKLINDYVVDHQTETPLLNISTKIYFKDQGKISLGADSENFHLFLGKQLLNQVFTLVDFNLSVEKQEEFITEINALSLTNQFVNKPQELFLKRGVIQGLRGCYMEAAFLLMPYIENLIRTRAQEQGWDASNNNGESRTPNKEALQLCIQSISDPEKIYLLQLLYTIVYDLPNPDVLQLAGGRVGDNVRNESLHGLMSDEEMFNQIMQAKYIMIWLIIMLLVLD